MESRGRTGRRTRTLLALGTAVLSVLRSSGAGGSDAPVHPVVVDTTIAVSSPEAGAFVDALDAVVGELGLRIRVERQVDAPPDGNGRARAQAPPPGAELATDVLAAVWIDARSPDGVGIRMTARGEGAPRVYTRWLGREGSTALLVEETAQVVRAALESIAASEPAPARAVDDAPPILPSPTPGFGAGPSVGPIAAPAAPSAGGLIPGPDPSLSQPTAATGVGLDALAFASARAMSAQSGPVAGAGAAFALSVGRAPWRPSIWLSGVYDERFDVQNGPVTFDVGTTSLRLTPSLELVQLASTQVDFGLGGGIDIFRIAPLVVRQSMAVFDATTTVVDPVVGGKLLLRIRLASQVRIVFGFDLDYDCALHTTTTPDDHPGGPHGSFVPWRVRPAVDLGLCLPLTSGGACTNR